MANDDGLIAKLEQWMADTLAALQSDGADVFKTAEVWKHQVAVGGSGSESFTSHQPFAFVGYLAADAAREGDNDLREVLEFGVLIGVESKHPGVARIGDANNLGISKIRDLVIAAFDRNHPGGSIECDPFYYTGDIKFVETDKRCAIQMHFECSNLNPLN